MKRPETVLAFMSSVFKGLSERVERLVEKVDEIEKAKAVSKPKKKPAAKARPKKKRAPVRKKVAVPKAKKVRKPRKAPVTDEVLKIIKKHKKGVDISQLKANTGFGDSRLRMIVSKAHKQGKIKRIARGIYVVA